LIAGGEFLALELGVSEAVVALTLVAFGTSIPELATTVVACMRQEPELAVGNAIGSCLFNLLCVGGITAAIKPLATTNISTTDMGVMVGFAVAAFFMMFRSQSLGRVGGAFLLISYFVYSILKFQ
jgi:cation:H+ antiporter